MEAVKYRKVVREFPLDGLRGAAALNVVMAHFVLAFCPELLKSQYHKLQVLPVEYSLLGEILSSFPVVVLFNGHFAVMVFFVLSGYVLSLPNYDGRKDALVSRLVLRFPRLVLPLLAAVIISYILWKYGGYANVRASVAGASKWFSRFYNGKPEISEAINELMFIGGNGFIPPGWTIRYELLGSVFLLTYCLFCPSRLQSLFLAPIAVVLWGITAQDSIYYISIFLGSLLCVLKYRGRGFLAFSFILGIYFGCYSELSGMYEHLPSLRLFDVEVFRSKDFYNLLGAILVVFSVRNGFGKRFFSSQPLQSLGVLSYSIYLLHFPVLCSLVAQVYLSGSFLFKNLFVMGILYALMVLSLGWIFCLLIDRPILLLLGRLSLYINLWVRRLVSI